MRRCRHVNRRGVRANEASPRADVIQSDCLPRCDGDNQLEVRGFTRGNGHAPGISVHVGIGSGKPADCGNHSGQLSLEFSLSGDPKAFASRIVELFTPIIREAVANIINNGSASPGESSGSAPHSSPPGTTKVVLSAGARSLLETIANVANSIDAQDDPRAAWISFTPWFEITKGTERHRADARSLILELTKAGFVEVYPRPKRNKYKVTVEGKRHLKLLNRG